MGKFHQSMKPLLSFGQFTEAAKEIVHSCTGIINSQMVRYHLLIISWFQLYRLAFMSFILFSCFSNLYVLISAPVVG